MSVSAFFSSPVQGNVSERGLQHKTS